ncbi:hypothetical protein [Acrocarpospora sp. B8E8]|uniref:hypothetical protein n=1 Tax=Acrocarpospora sp. B8E8 TaxID=3153572 RepID=UPI00325F426E
MPTPGRAPASAPFRRRARRRTVRARFGTAAALTLASLLAVLVTAGPTVPPSAPAAADAAISATPPTPTPAATTASTPTGVPQSPGPTQSPRPAATPSPSPAPGAPAKCEVLDLGCHASDGITIWFRGLASAAIGPIFDQIGTTLLVTPQVEQLPRVRQMWSASAVIANTLFVLFVIAGGLTVMSHETLQTSYTVKDIAPRLVVGIIAANFSALAAGKAIEFANALAAALLGDTVTADQASGMLRDRLVQNLAAGSVFQLLMILVAVVFALLLSGVYVVRLMVTILLVAAAPLALACHALPQTEEWARLWWRLLSGVLLIQVAQALVFITAVKVMFTPDGPITDDSQGWDLLITLCLLYVLIRIPGWIMNQVMHANTRRSPIVRVTRYFLYRQAITSAVRTGGRGRHP